MKQFFLKLTRFWNEDRSLSITLLLLLLFIFVLVPSLTPSGGGEISIKITYSIILLTGIFSVAKSKMFVTIVGIAAVISLFVNWLSEVEPTRPVFITHDVVAIFFNLLFGFAILLKTFKEGEITFQRIQGSIVVYLVIGLTFSYAFHAIYLLSGDTSFNNLKGDGLKEFLYFSLTSLTTMGYGDITPVHPIARSFANLEALIGQLYPAILIARLVSMEFESSTRKKETNR